MGITIVGIDETQGKRILELLEKLNLLQDILDRVKRIPGRAASLQFTLGKKNTQ